LKHWKLCNRYLSFHFPDFTLNFHNLYIEKSIGEGTFGKVKLGSHVLTGEKVAVKILEKERIIDVADVERVAREIHILRLIRHPNIIQLYEVIQQY
jgi:serine/threonine protein kinase